MHITELPLLIFTILGQMSAGAFIVLGAVRIFARATAGSERVERLSDVSLYAIGPTLALGFAGSFLHLGNPINAANALNHLSSSGMSREILAGVLFAAFGGIYALFQYRRWGTPLVRHVLASITALLGVVLVWMMASLYLLPTVPAWNTWITPASFFTTALLLGSMAVTVALTAQVCFPNLRVPSMRAEPINAERDGAIDTPARGAADHALVKRVITWVVCLAIMCLGATIVLSLLHISMLSTHPSDAASRSLAVATDAHGMWLAARALLTLIGTAVLGIHLYRIRGDRANVTRTTLVYVVVAFLLIFTGEVIGREMFYAEFARIGL